MVFLRSPVRLLILTCLLAGGAAPRAQDAATGDHEQHAASIQVGGYAFPQRVSVNGSTLLLNGAGIRRMAFFKVYAMGLYLSRITKIDSEAIQMPGNKRMLFYMMRDVPMAQFNQLMNKGLHDNASPEELLSLKPDIERLERLLAAYPVAQEGDALVLDWAPQLGMTAHFRGMLQGEPFRNPLLFKLMLKIWLGDAPRSPSLKAALLGDS